MEQKPVPKERDASAVRIINADGEVSYAPSYSRKELTKILGDDRLSKKLRRKGLQ